MHSSPQETPGDAYPDPFPAAWFTTEPTHTIINTAPAGVALLRAVRSETGQITDFRYWMVNAMHRALAKHPAEDLLSLPLTSLIPDVIKMDMMNRLIEVVNTGQPSRYVEEYRLDGIVGRYDQV